MPRVSASERGLSTGVQVALLFPLAFGVLLLALQWAMLSWAEATALAAAQDGARVAAGFNGSPGHGSTTAASAADNGSLSDVQVAVERGPARTTVTVTGSAVSVLPGLVPQVSKSAELPTERLTR